MSRRRPAQGLAEYALILTLVALVLVGVLFIFGNSMAAFYTNAASTVANPFGAVP